MKRRLPILVFSSVFAGCMWTAAGAGLELVPDGDGRRFGDVRLSIVFSGATGWPKAYFVDGRERLCGAKLTLKKKGGEFPVAALRLNLLAVRDASDIVFDGISFECSRGDAVLIDDCRNVTLRGCSVRQTGGWGVKVTGGARCRVEGCDMWELGEGGVRLEGGDLKSLEPAEHVADNNHIHHYGRFIANYRPGVSLNGVGCRATHNLVHHSEHQGAEWGLSPVGPRSLLMERKL